MLKLAKGVFSMRMRNKSWAKPFLNEKNEFVVANPSENQGKWNSLLNSDIIHVEIGSGKGDYFCGMSKLYADHGWVGIEKNSNVAAIAVKKALENPSENSLFIANDAKDINEWFKEKEVDYIHLNFSDPWPKNGNRKRRLSHQNFIDKYYQLLKENGCIVMKTDNKDLFEFSLLEFANTNFKLIEFSTDFRRNIHDEDTITEYEAKFMELNQPIYRAVFQKR